MASVAWAEVQTSWTADQQVDLVRDGHGQSVSFRLGSLGCQLVMLVERCVYLVWCISRGYACNDEKRLGKPEAVVGKWRAGAWK